MNAGINSKIKQQALQVRKMEEAAFKWRVESMKELIRQESIKEHPMFDVVKDEMKTLFISCMKAQSKYVTTPTEDESKSEISWLEEL